MPTVDVGGLAVPFPHAEPYPEQLEYMVRQCSDFTPTFIGMHRNAPLSPTKESARVHHSYGSYAPSTYGSYGPRKANPSTGRCAPRAWRSPPWANSVHH